MALVTNRFSAAFEATLDWVELRLARREAKRRSRRRRSVGKVTQHAVGGVRRDATI